MTAVGGPDAVVIRTPVTLKGDELPQPRPLQRRRGRDGAVRADLLPLAPRRADARSTPRRALAETVALVARVGGALQLPGPVARPGGALADHPEGADLRADRRRSSRRRPPRCPRRSAARATGTTASAGCATPPSRSTRCMMSGYADEARAWRDWLLRAVAGTRRRCRSCTASAASGGCRSSSCRGSPATRAAGRCGSATRRARQVQLDVYGEVMDALHVARGRTCDAGPTTPGRCS